jgi:hypothetical protein
MRTKLMIRDLAIKTRNDVAANLLDAMARAMNAMADAPAGTSAEVLAERSHEIRALADKLGVTHAWVQALEELR